MSDSVWPHRRQPTRLPIPGILQARTLESVAISFSNAWKWKVKVKSLCRAGLFATPWTAAYQAPLSTAFSRQEYWSGLPYMMLKANSLEKTLVLERLKAGGEGGDSGWDGCMASPTQWIYVWANSRTWWRTGKPGVLQSMGSQSIRHDLATEQQQSVIWSRIVAARMFITMPGRPNIAKNKQIKIFKEYYNAVYIS